MEQQSPINLKTGVLVVGAGPVGSVLALELARHGVPSVLVERSVAASRHPKMDYINGRSMELLRRLGLTGALRERGIHAQHSTDFLWTRTFAEPPVMIWHQPSVSTLADHYAAVDDGSAPAEPYLRIQGSLLEEVVRDAARSHRLIDMREGWTLTGLWQCQGSVQATVVEAATGVRHSITAAYVAGCDGARSMVRECMEIPVENTIPPTQHCSIYFRSKDPVLRKHGRAFVTVSAGLTLVSRDEDEMWTCSIPVPADEPFTGDPMAVVRQRLGVSFEVDEIRSMAQWEGALAVAKAYRFGSVFLAGDAAHQFFPTGGLGANTGLADAVDLGWKLAAVLNGWGGPRLLDSYERERRPVALFNREMSANLLEVWRRFARLTELGASRAHLAGFLEQDRYQINNPGIQFDYRYEDSPVICAEQGDAPGWRWDRITPSTWPGCRVPAVRLSGGVQVYDLLGPAMTLVDLSGGNFGALMVRHACEMGIPMTHLVLTDAALSKCWERELVLVRPDHHVAWRGNEPPSDWDKVLSKVTGQDLD